MGVSIPWVPLLGALWGQIQLRATGLHVGAGVTRLLQARVSFSPRMAPLLQGAPLPSVPMPGVEQEDLHCC